MRSTCIDNWEMLICLHVSDELLKLAEEGFGRYIDKTEMENDKILEQRKCFSAFVKNDIRDVNPNIFRGLNESDCSAESYEVNYNKSMDIVMKKVALKYHTNKDLLLISPELDPTDSKYRYRTINIQYESSKNFYSLA